MFPMFVGKISLVALVLVGPVCAILASVPAVIVVVPRVVDTDLDMFRPSYQQLEIWFFAPVCSERSKLQLLTDFGQPLGKN